MKNIALTGVPRSGTTLVVNLLNQVENVIALHEPIIAYRYLKGLDRYESIEKIIQFFNDSRISLLNRKLAVTKHRNGLIPDNSITDEYSGENVKELCRKDRMEHGEIQFNKQLSESFDLFIKDPTLFTALLPDLKERIPTFAIIRNPVSVLLSWNSVPFKISTGRIPPAEKYDKNLFNKLNQENSTLERQGIIMNWYFTNYLENLETTKIIKYEDIILTNGQVLSKLGIDTRNLIVNLSDKNTNPIYDKQLVESIITVIRKYYSQEFEQFYSFDYLLDIRNRLLSE